MNMSPRQLLEKLLSISLWIFYSIIFFSILVLVGTFFGAELWSLDLCMSRECVNFFIEKMDALISILNFGSGLLVVFGAAGGLYVALLNYVNAVAASALSNHVAHLNAFDGYIRREIIKRARISPSSVDSLRWYNLIFDESRLGRANVSSGYREFIGRLNGELEYSNRQAAEAREGSFRYKPHQERIISVLRDMGIAIVALPRNDFFEVEGQVIDLIETVNRAFCGKDCAGIIARNYI